jgi:hypothetical protein
MSFSRPARGSSCSEMAACHSEFRGTERRARCEQPLTCEVIRGRPPKFGLGPAIDEFARVATRPRDFIAGALSPVCG